MNLEYLLQYEHAHRETLAAGLASYSLHWFETIPYVGVQLPQAGEEEFLKTITKLPVISYARGVEKSVEEK